MHKNAANVLGQRFGRLVVVEQLDILRCIDKHPCTSSDMQSMIHWHKPKKIQTGIETLWVFGYVTQEPDLIKRILRGESFSIDASFYLTVKGLLTVRPLVSFPSKKPMFR